MRVLMLSKAAVVGIYQRKLEEIARRGVELLALVPPSWRDERGEMPLERAYTQGYRLETLPIVLNGSFHLHFYRELGWWMNRFRPHVVHIDEEPYNVAAWQAIYHARRVGAKTLLFSWQNILRRYPPPFDWGERWALRHANTLIAGTESAAEVWREKGYTGAIRVIPQFGTDTDLFQPAERRPERSFTIGYFGRLIEDKGLRVLLDACTRLEGDWQLYVLGSGPLRGELETYAARLGIWEQTVFHEQIASTEMPAQYHKLDAFVLPSLTRPNWKEQFGRVLVEAMASGVPVVGSDSGAIPGVIGDAGLLVPEGDPAALADALERLRCDPALYADLSRRGRERAIANFTHEGVAQATVEVYEELIQSIRKLQI
jgi:glycosyltransferase involved in cell wall biosynthesis